MRGLTNKKVSDKRAVSVPMEELRKMESALIAAKESQSFNMWLVGALIHYAKSSGFVPPDVTLFEWICTSISGAQVRTNALISKVQAYSVLQRRSLALAHAPATLSEDQRINLLSSSLHDERLFAESAIASALSEHQADVACSSCLGSSGQETEDRAVFVSSRDGPGRFPFGGP